MGWVVVPILQFANKQERLDIEGGTETLKRHGAVEVNNAFLDTSPRISKNDDVIVISHGSNFSKIGHYLEPMFKNAKGALIFLLSCELGSRDSDKDVVMKGCDPADTYAQRVAEASGLKVIASSSSAKTEDVFEPTLVKWATEVKNDKHKSKSHGKWRLFIPKNMMDTEQPD